MRKLCDLSVGEAGRVWKTEGNLNQRLRDLGFTRGAVAECLFAAPGCGMRAYRVRGAVIALRQRDARRVALEDDRHE
ncbi:MAG: ferrous iron transport protein A [Clostridia bacterium]|nr:ferrous iron transport protein A [Clostridia bacterium]